MTRSLAILCVLLLPACIAQESYVSLAGTFGSTATTGNNSTGGGADTSTAEVSDPQRDGTESGSSGADGSGTGEGESGGSSSSGEPGAVCGDGVVEGDEECDDANMIEGDGCLGNCTRE